MKIFDFFRPSKEKFQGQFTSYEMDAFAQTCGWKWNEARKKWSYPCGREIDPHVFPWVFYMTVGNNCAAWREDSECAKQNWIGRHLMQAACKLQAMGGRYSEMADDLQPIIDQLVPKYH